MSISWPPACSCEAAASSTMPHWRDPAEQTSKCWAIGSQSEQGTYLFSIFCKLSSLGLISAVVGWSSFYSSVTLCLGLSSGGICLTERIQFPLEVSKLWVKFLDFKKEKLLRSKYMTDSPLGNYVRKEKVLTCCCHPVLVARCILIRQCHSSQERISHGI